MKKQKPAPRKKRQVHATKHNYISTACHHKKHDLCRRWCKYCGVDCACTCHRHQTLHQTLGPEKFVGKVAAPRKPHPYANIEDL